MNEHQYAPSHCVLSIGHSNHTLDRFLELLQRHNIEVLVDVRSHPYSKFAPHFNTPSLKEAVVRVGIKYLSMGNELGGRPNGQEFYDSGGYVLYWRVAESPLFLDGISRLENGIMKYRIALMCSEEDPSACHRRLLVGRVLSKRGIQVDHIRADGKIQTEMELERKEEHRRTENQMGFFRESSEENAWKSIQSVLQRSRRQTSSGR